jgi:hypothetical protein
MSPIEQLIADADAAITASPTATTGRTLLDAVRADQCDNYRSAWFTGLDLLVLSVPRPGERCRFRLIVSPGTGRQDAVSFVVGQADDTVWRAEWLPGGNFQLIPAGNTAVTEIAELIRRAGRTLDEAGKILTEGER